MKMSGWLGLILVWWTSAAMAFSFPCEKEIAETSAVLHCQNKIGNYPLPVDIYIPKNLNEESPIHLNIHFHGHNIDGYNHQKNFASMLLASNRNSILIVPESIGKCTTYDNFFADEVAGKDFIFKLINITQLKINSLSFSGHSGAYRVLRKIFSYKNLNFNVQLNGVGIFDATYSDISSIVNFALTHNDFLFFDKYVDGEKGTTDEISRALQSKYQNQSNFYFEPMASTNESVLTLHFRTILEGGLEKFLMMLK